MTKLTDLQLVLLSTAAARSGGSLLPPAASITTQAGRIRRSIAALVSRELAADLAVTDQALSYRADGEILFGALITNAGRCAAGVEPAPAASPALPADADAGPTAEAPSSDADEAAATEVGSGAVNATPGTPRSGSKSALVIELLVREQGATIDELTSATGWLPHTTRAALAGLRKKGHGRPMSPAHAIKGDRRYRYYVSRTRDGDAEQGWRIPAGDLETIVQQAVASLLRDPLRLSAELGLGCSTCSKPSVRCAELAEQASRPAALRALLERLEAKATIYQDRIEVALDRRARDADRRSLDQPGAGADPAVRPGSAQAARA